MNDQGRALDWPNCYNIRELGGVPLKGGGTTRRGMFVRADTLHYLDATGWKALVSHGVRTILDLRVAGEARNRPYTPPEGVRYIRHPMLAMDAGTGHIHGRAESRGHEYLLWLQEYADATAAILRIIAGAKGEVLFHCQTGKDRTGVIAALLLEAVGAQDKAIIADYAASQDYLWPWWEAATNEGRGPDRPIAKARTMHDFLQYLRITYGGAVGYMRHIGVDEHDIDALRMPFGRAVEP